MSKKQKPDHKQVLTNLAKDLHELVSDKQKLRASVDNFLNNLIDELTLGIIFDQHRKYKTNAYDLDVADGCEEVESSEIDIFGQFNLKKTQDCVCPNCDRAVAATRFAPHLETCMGMGRVSRSRNATRRVASCSKDNSSYGGLPSDDDDDGDWSSVERRKKKKDKNGSKKRGTPKKNFEPEVVDPVNVDIEGDDDDLTNLRDILHLQDHSNSTSPADSASSSGSTKKRDKPKNKKNNKRDRGSPTPSL
ncbi:SAGA-associated factor 11 homolog [Leptinotarsa decemlineata]|uniref:SAGA-associated factor 11 homolog n=1 Tax=Leptinotarsa decemlineata TaxID=7539 RepID=UPI000C254299|nr:SAGA-associated factor 11 homolog [Leptinotarsa decemlineata]